MIALKRAFGSDLTSLSYLRALALLLQLDFDSWRRRLGDLARFLHLSLYHQCSPNAHARFVFLVQNEKIFSQCRCRSAASMLAGLLSTGSLDAATSGALPLAVRVLLRCAIPRQQTDDASAYLRAQFAL